MCFLHGNALSLFVNLMRHCFIAFGGFPVTSERENEWLLISFCVALKCMCCSDSNCTPAECIRRLRSLTGREGILLFPHTYCFNAGKLVDLSVSLPLYDFMDVNSIMSQNWDKGWEEKYMENVQKIVWNMYSTIIVWREIFFFFFSSFLSTFFFFLNIGGRGYFLFHFRTPSFWSLVQ